MSTKDYELVAEVLLHFDTDEETHTRLVEAFCDEFEQHNPRFDRLKFSIASGKV